MATNYPASTDNGTSLPYPSATNDTNSPSLAGGQDNQNDAIIAVETLVGTNATQTTPSSSGNVLQATSATASEWGLLTSSNVSTSTGTGEFVFATSPTLTSPTLNTPTITSPSITGSLGNISTGTINASGLITANSGLTLPVGALFTAGGGLTVPAGQTTSLNGGLTVLQNFTATGLVNYADLLSTIFSGQLQTYALTGTAGSGTGHYINLGGIKWCFGITSPAIAVTSGSAYWINMPTNFFTTILYGDMKYFNPGSANNSYATQVATISSIQIYAAEATNTQFEWLAIGT